MSQDVKEIVARLRERIFNHDAIDGDVIEAADLIEQQATRIAALEEGLQTLVSTTSGFIGWLDDIERKYEWDDLAVNVARSLLHSEVKP